MKQAVAEGTGFRKILDKYVNTVFQRLNHFFFMRRDICSESQNQIFICNYNNFLLVDNDEMKLGI